MYSVIVNPSVIGIYGHAKLISHNIRVDFARNTKNTFSGRIEKVILKCLGHSNNKYIKRYKYKIVINLTFSNLPILR